MLMEGREGGTREGGGGVDGKKWLGAAAPTGKAATDRGGGNGKEQRRGCPAVDWRADSMWGERAAYLLRGEEGVPCRSLLSPPLPLDLTLLRLCMTRAPCNERGSAAFPNGKSLRTLMLSAS